MEVITTARAGVPSPWAVATIGPWPVKNRATEAAVECMRTAPFVRGACECAQLHLCEQRVHLPTTCANGATHELAHRLYGTSPLPIPHQSTKPENLETAVVEHGASYPDWVFFRTH